MELNEIILFGILIGIHTLLHLGLEIYYNYNPVIYLSERIYSKDEIN